MRFSLCGLDRKRSLLVVLFFVVVSCQVIQVHAATYFGSRNSDVYHCGSCRYVTAIKSQNLVTFSSPERAIAAGYHPCKVCNPPTSSGAGLDFSPDLMICMGLVAFSVPAVLIYGRANGRSREKKMVRRSLNGRSRERGPHGSKVRTQTSARIAALEQEEVRDTASSPVHNTRSKRALIGLKYKRRVATIR
jgi:hypothetical protein